MEPRETTDQAATESSEPDFQGLSREQIFEHGNFEELATRTTGNRRLLPFEKKESEEPSGKATPTEKVISDDSLPEPDEEPPELETELDSTKSGCPPAKDLPPPRPTIVSRTDGKALRKQFTKTPEPARKRKRVPLFSIEFLRSNLFTIAGGLAIVVLFGGAFVAFKGVSSFYALVVPEPSAAPKVVSSESSPETELYLTAEMEAGAMEAIRGYLAADGWEAKLPYVRHAETIRPLMERFYNLPGNKDRDGPLEAGPISMRGQVVDEGRFFVKIALPTVPGYDLRFFVVERTPEGEYKLDWEVSEVYQEMPYDNFVRRRPREPKRFRVQALQTDYFNFHFDDPEKWLAYELSNPAQPEFKFFGYVERDSTFGRQLAEKAPPGLVVSLILTLAYPEDVRDDRQVEIRELISTTWFR